MRILVVCLLLLAGLPVAALAGPPEGDLYGYRLGERYTLGSATTGRYMPSTGAIAITAERPRKPVDIERVELIVTPATLTILNIYGVTEFDNEQAAKALATRHADALKAAQAGKCFPVEAFLDETLKLLCGGRHELSVTYFPPATAQDKHWVQISLKYDSSSATGKQAHAQLERELDQLETQGKTAQLEQALTPRKLKGLR